MSTWELFRASMEAAENYRRARNNFAPPAWALRPPGLYQPIPSTFRKCVWCKDHLSIFGPKACRLGGHDLHVECNGKAVRFALKASIRNRTNPATGYFPGWRTP